LLVVLKITVALGRLVVDDDQFVVRRPVDSVNVADEFVPIKIEFEFPFRVDEVVRMSGDTA
jgi:hypothetical protein